MTENQILLLAWVVSVVGRIPRIVERWNSPFLNGPGWFFGIQVPSDFILTDGRAILNSYRWRLFLPWVVEIPISAALLIGGHYLAILGLVFVITLLTRVNYYADRNAAERKAGTFAIPGTAKPVFNVALSLQPRSLRTYTNPWIEVPILLTLLVSLAWLAYRYAVLRDWYPIRGPLSANAMFIYLQLGLLLMKRGFVRARSVAPADKAEPYLAWRESLRRLSTTVSDYIRLMLVFIPVTADLVSITPQWRGSAAQIAVSILALALMAILAWCEWWSRQQHLVIARATKPAGFFVLPDTLDAGRFVCFRRSLPMLLLKGPNGYALNLASAPAKTGSLYFAGYALLVACLTR